MSTPIWKLLKGGGPLVAAAVHDGHEIRPELLEIMNLEDADRLREEDPFTGMWTVVSDTRIIGTHSRFEVDLNRPREKAVYLEPQDAWGLAVWKKRPSAEIIEGSLAAYDAFYAMAKDLFSDLNGGSECLSYLICIVTTIYARDRTVSLPMRFRIRKSMSVPAL